MKKDEDAKVFLPNNKDDYEPENLEFDETSYVMYHVAQTGSPCLSFDVIPDDLGASRENFPHTMYLISGTQCPKSEDNRLIVMKLSNLTKITSKDEEGSDEEIEEDILDESSPDFEFAYLSHDGTTNRIRCTRMPNAGPCLAASWSENAAVYIWNLSLPLEAIDNPSVMSSYVRRKEYPKPVFNCQGYTQEGFALDWSKLSACKLLTGDCSGCIKLWIPKEAEWTCAQNYYKDHENSVEDIQWSPVEESVFASCSVDKSIRIFDTRANKHMLSVQKAHDADVNVISWNKQEPFIISGGDEGILKVWDLRTLKTDSQNKPFGFFKHHTGPITSVEWHPTDSSVFAASAADNQLTIWDLAVEKVDNDENDPELQDIPSQLLFVHMGQKDIKELHWHAQIPGTLISTALTGFNIFKTISV